MYKLLTYHSLLNLAFSYYLGEIKHDSDRNEQYNNYQFRLNPFLNSQPNYIPLRQKQVYPTELPLRYSLNMTFFPILFMKQYQAIKIEYTEAPWIAKVLLSKVFILCTASCIGANIFVTAARCLASLKIKYTQVYYRNDFLVPVAFVMPTNNTRTMFDDIGFIVTDSKIPAETWDYLTPYKIERNDTYMDWFNEFRSGTAYGYVHEPQEKEIQFIYKLPVVMSSYLCRYIYATTKEMVDYFVPCYHSCDLVEDYFKNSTCNPYLRGEGHAVLVNDQLIGVATWGSDSQEKNHPVGMAVINSDAYKEDLKCATEIRDAVQKGATEIPTCQS